MIHIDKPEKGPEILNNQGRKETERMMESAENGETDFSFDSHVYSDESVKQELRKNQHEQCAYCECCLVGDYGAVEHYRPKSGYKIGKRLIKPGYFWLAYDWNNLLCSCDVCNNKKGNEFPLKDETERDLSHYNISKEHPLLVNPVTDDPGKHIIFREEMACGLDEMGKTTIRVLDLNRAELKKIRKNYWDFWMELQEKISREELLEISSKYWGCFRGMFLYQDWNLTSTVVGE